MKFRAARQMALVVLCSVLLFGCQQTRGTKEEQMIYFGFAIMWGIIWGLIGALTAKNRGRSSGAWFFIGFFFGPFVLSIFLFARLSKKPRTLEESSARCPKCAEPISEASLKCPHCQTEFKKRCPYCAEPIRVEAIKCCHCGSDVGIASESRSTTPAEEKQGHSTSTISPNTEQQAVIDGFIRNGSKVEAVRYVRSQFDVTLIEAKNWVEALSFVLRSPTGQVLTASVAATESQPTLPKRSPAGGSGVIELDLGVGGRMQFVWIDPGEFRMGSDEKTSEQPVHLVQITKGFWMGKYVVTQEQYAAVMGTNQNQLKGERLQYASIRRYRDETNPTQFKGERLPVVDVSWEEAVTFCRKIGGRLPTEAEWEYACRAGTTTKYNTGNSLLALWRAAWFNLSCGGWWSSGIPREVGQKAPNALGLYDMHGNVFEWCQDWSGGDYRDSPLQDPKGPPSGNCRVMRGGSIRDNANECRAASRWGAEPSIRMFMLGFRVCLSE